MSQASYKIQGRVASKKNNKRLVKTRGGRMIPISSQAWMKFHKEATKQLKAQGIKKLKAPYQVEYMFYMKGKAATDIDNMMAGINDIIEKLGIVTNDKHILRVVAEKVTDEPYYETVVTIKEL